MGERVKVKFLKPYIANRGAGISGGEGDFRMYAMTDQLEALIADGTVELCADAPAAKRETATTSGDTRSKKKKKKKAKSK